MGQMYNVVKDGKIVLSHQTLDSCDHFVEWNVEGGEECEIVEVS